MKRNLEDYLSGMAVGIYLGMFAGLFLTLWLTKWPAYTFALFMIIAAVAIVSQMVLTTIVRLMQIKREHRERMKNLHSVDGNAVK